MAVGAMHDAQPIPLTDPDGRVIAYACPVCFRAGFAESIYGRGHTADEVAAMRLATSREQAAKCCRCRVCYAQTRHDYARIECEGCAQKRYARERESDAHPPVIAPEPRWRSTPPSLAEFYALPDAENGRAARLFLTRSDGWGLRVSRIICTAGSLYFLDDHGDEYPIHPECIGEIAPIATVYGTVSPVEWPVV